MGSGRTSGDLLRVVSWYLSRLLPRLRLSDPQQIRHASVGQSMIPRCRRAMASGLPPWTVIPACAQLRSAMWQARRPGLRSRMICRNSRSLVAARDSPRFGAPIEEVGPYRLADRGAGFGLSVPREIAADRATGGGFILGVKRRSYSCSARAWPLSPRHSQRCPGPLLRALHSRGRS